MIHWFPGHMAKTRRLISESLRLVDGVLHLADARLPESSQNPLLYNLVGAKPTLLVLAKADLADPAKTAGWLARHGGGLAVSLVDQRDKKRLLAYVHSSLDHALTKRFPRPWRVMVAGIPNVGKSTLINLLAARRAAKVGDRPGITRSEQWIRVSPGLEMLDTPGILWPRLEDREVSLRLAAAGCIRDEILPLEDVARWLLQYLEREYPAAAAAYADSSLAAVAEKLGVYVKGGGLDLRKAAELLLKSFRDGRLGRISLEGEGEGE